jgi:hypothetical protein
VFTQTYGGHGRVGVQDRHEGVDVRRVQSVVTRERVHQLVDLAVHPAQRDGEGVQVGQCRGAV